MKLLIIGEDEANYGHICLRLPGHQLTFCDTVATALVVETPLVSFDRVFVIVEGNFRESVRVLSEHFSRLDLLHHYYENVSFLPRSPMYWPIEVNKSVAGRATMRKI